MGRKIVAVLVGTMLLSGFSVLLSQVTFPHAVIEYTTKVLLVAWAVFIAQLVAVGCKKGDSEQMTAQENELTEGGKGKVKKYLGKER